MAFPTTQWSAIEAAAGGDPKQLSWFCSRYWRPVYAFILSRVRNETEARDLTQDFFEYILDRDVLAAADRERGRFRSFLAVILKRFLANDAVRRGAQKRGGSLVRAPLDQALSGGLIAGKHLPPDKAFELQWALELVERALVRLEAYYEQRGRGELFARMKPFLITTSPRSSYAAVAAAASVSPECVKVNVLRMRRRFGTLLRDEVAQTVSDSGEVDDEVRYLLRILSE